MIVAKFAAKFPRFFLAVSAVEFDLYLFRY